MKKDLTEKIFVLLCYLSMLFGLFFLASLFFSIISDGISSLSLSFLSSYPSRFPEKSGIKPAIFGSLYVSLFMIIISVPIGVASAVYLEEYSRKSGLSRVIELSIANLAATPSIVFGILGNALFVMILGLGRSVISGALTLTLLALPTIIITSRESLRSIPNSVREASYAMGATRWQTVQYQLLPAAIPGIMTGIILSLSRIIGETAPLIMIGALTFITFLPVSPLDPFTVLPIQIFNWISRPQEGFHRLAAATIIFLLVFLLSLNSVAVWLRNKYQLKW